MYLTQSLSFQIPSLFATLANTKYDYSYHASLPHGVGKARASGDILLSRGKVLGGCSTTNYLVNSRGVPRDYNDWSLTSPGWSWEEVLPYFKKFENMTDPSVFSKPQNAELHSTEGPVKISRPDDNFVYAEVNKIRINAFSQIGIPPVLENSGPKPFGISRPHFTFADGRRSSVAEAYLRNVRKPNLCVAKYTRATKILINANKQAYGVEVLNRNGEKLKVFARFDVIVSAGTIDSAKLLLLSGIGPEDELAKHGIDPVVYLPVGLNMQDHQFIPLPFAGKKGIESAFSNLLVPTQINEFPVPFQSSFFRLDNIPSNDPVDRPQFQTFNIYVGATASLLIYYGCLSYGFVDQVCSSLAKHNHIRELDIMSVLLMHPKSRGFVKLKSTNPLDNPIIHMGFLKEQEDVAMLREGIKYLSLFGNTTYYRDVHGYLAKLDVPGCEGWTWASDEYWDCYVKASVGSMQHPVGTCRMAPDGVVSERLLVHGVSNLRVADASIMPEISSGNTNAPTMMIGEKASDIIKEDYGIYARYWS